MDDESAASYSRSKLLKARILQFIISKKPLVLLFSFFILLFLTVSAYFLYINERMLPGVSISQFYVGNLVVADARKKLKFAEETILSQTLTINIKTKAIDVSLKDLGLSLQVEEALETAFAIGRSGQMWESAVSKVLIPIKGSSIPLKSTWDSNILRAALEKLLQPYDHAAKDASFSITSDHLMQIIPDETGLQADINALADLVTRLDPFNLTPLTVPYRQTLPTVTAAELEQQKITGMLASYTTNFDANLRGRSENIRLASASLDGILLKPGEEFSFNRSVGQRTAAAGYQEAIIIENGRFVPGLGGGVCQVSSTLYNVVLLSRLKVVERHPHALPVAYVPPGKDATVAWGSLDFKFKNDSGGYALITSHVGSGSLTISIYGKK